MDSNSGSCEKNIKQKQNYTEVDKKVFLAILKTYSHVIENKKSDGSTLKEKEFAWAQVAENFNNSTVISSKRSVVQLKKLWSNIKTSQRNALTKEKQARLATGGGPEPTAADVDPLVIEIVPDLMITAPTAFSSNIAEEVQRAIQESVFDDQCVLLEELVQNESGDCPTAEVPQPKKRNADVDDLDIQPKSKKRSTKTEEELKLERLKRIIGHNKELSDLKMKHEKEKHALEMEFLRQKYALELEAAKVHRG